jgi:hypothetical protein
LNEDELEVALGQEESVEIGLYGSAARLDSVSARAAGRLAYDLALVTVILGAGVRGRRKPNNQKEEEGALASMHSLNT